MTWRLEGRRASGRQARLCQPSINVNSGIAGSIVPTAAMPSRPPCIVRKIAVSEEEDDSDEDSYAGRRHEPSSSCPVQTHTITRANVRRR